MLSEIEQKRLQISKSTEAEKKAKFGQFLTPESTAAFMAGLFPKGNGRCRLLDAGAGIGSLSAAFLDRWKAGGLGFHRVDVDAFEVDPELTGVLTQTLERYGSNRNFRGKIYEQDFIHAAVESLSGSLFSEHLGPYTHAILNPPYKKINSRSPHRQALRRVGIETVNLYSAFVALAVEQTEEGGHIVAIIPRSFCNGPYYRPFRKFVMKRAAIRHLHLFDSRNKAFKDDSVLQENIIILLEKGRRPGKVEVSTSTDNTFVDLASKKLAYHQIVKSGDDECLIHIPTTTGADALVQSPEVSTPLADLGVNVSTGPVVDFRLKVHLRMMPGPGTVPLLYPCHFTGQGTVWPLQDAKKPNAIACNESTGKWLFPKGCYCVVRRFSSKEERRRIVASVVEPGIFKGASFLGFENHLNVFHIDKHGLPQPLAYGLATYLNSTDVDVHFRSYSGHTQVNATDLKRMKYPSLALLAELGDWAMMQQSLDQALIDAKVRSFIQ